MPRPLIVTLLVFSFLEAGIALAQEHRGASCAEYDLSGLKEASPVVRVEPVFGEELRTDGVDSCLVLVFALREKAGTSGDALFAHELRSVAWSDEVPPGAREAAERAVGQWLFLTRIQPASEDPVYFVRFTF